MARFLFTQEALLIVLLSYSRWRDRKSTAVPNFILAAEFASLRCGTLDMTPTLANQRPSDQFDKRQIDARVQVVTFEI
jgi:hypothetical protein